MVSEAHDGSEPEIAPEMVELEVDGVLDLHAFRPQEMIEVVESYLEVCLEKKIPVVRIIHGKGIGVQKTRVHAFLERCPYVLRFGIDSRTGSGWGATIAYLKLD